MRMRNKYKIFGLFKFSYLFVVLDVVLTCDKNWPCFIEYLHMFNTRGYHKKSIIEIEILK